MALEKISTGIGGLDEMLEGGLPKNRHVAIFGGPGTGKTTFGMQFLYDGAKKGETGFYATLEELPEQLMQNATTVFSGITDLKQYVDNQKIIIQKPDQYNIDSLVELIENGVVNNNASRVVVDSSTVVEAFFNSQEEYRRAVVEFLNLLKGLDASVYFLVEAQTAEVDLSYKLEHYIMDGIINLYNLQRGSSRVRALEVYKMRGTKHSQNLVPLKITPEGIKVYPSEKVL